MAKIKRGELQMFQMYPDYGITAKLCWANNYREKRDTQMQILFSETD